MKDKIQLSLITTAVLFLLCVFINLIHFSWYYVQPEGFWGFSYFLGILSLSITITLILLASIFFTVAGLFSLLTDFRNNFNLKSIAKAIAFFIFFIIMMLINHFWIAGGSLYFNKKMTDKYSYIEKSDEFINKGEYDEALKYSRKSYEKEKGNSTVCALFILTKLYARTQHVIEEKIEARYSTTLNYAYCLQQISLDTKEAEAKYLEALSIANSDLFKDKENHKIFPTLSLSQIYLGQGKYTEAEDYFDKVVALANLYQPDDVEYVCLNQEIFAKYADRIGDNDKAARLRKNSLKIYEENNLNKKSIFYLALLINSAYSNLITGDMYEAGEDLTKAQPLAKKRKDKEIFLEYLTVKGMYCQTAANKGYGNESVLNNSIWQKIKEQFYSDKTFKARFAREAENCFEELVKKSKSKNGRNSIGYIISSTNLASFYFNQSRFDESEKIYKQALDAFNPFKENNKALYDNLLLKKIIVSLYSKDTINISNTLESIESNLFEKLSTNYLFLTEDEKETYKASLDMQVDLMNAIYLNLSPSKYSDKIYNNIISTKNVALYSNQYIREFISKNTDLSFKTKYFRLLEQKEQLNNKAALMVDNNIDDQLNDLQLKEKSLIKTIQTNKSFKAFNPRSVTWIDIRNSLKTNQAAIELINIPKNPLSKDTVIYYALIIKKSSLQPEILPVFSENDLLKILNKGGDSKQQIDSIYLTNKEQLYNLIWAPIENKLAGISKVYLSVSGQLNRVSLPGILYDKKLDIELLGSTRQVTTLNGNSTKKYSIALFGNIDYGKKQSPELNNSSNREFAEPLKYSYKEILNIQSLFTSYRFNTELFTDTIATKSSFISLQNKDINVIHLATHAYYHPSNILESNNIPQEIGLNKNPLNKCGIMLTGVNNYKGQYGKSNNGIMTAMEISKLDLSNVQMVILSACNTGLGDISGSEGVFGLQRAFKIAGVHSTIVSLWNVDDESTAELMTRFYTYLLKGYSNSISLKIAQEEIRKKPKFNSPYYWAGFILVNN